MQSKQQIKSGLLVFLIAGLFILGGCNVKPTTMGYQHRIFVVSDSLLWQQIGPQIEQVFERVIYTPHTEKTFYITPISLQKLNEFKSRMNVFFIGVEEPQSETATYIKKMLPGQFQKGLDDGSYFYLFAKDMFARDQINLVMFAKDTTAFKEQLQKLKDNIYNSFQKKYYARLSQSMFEQGEQEKLERYLGEHYGWKVRMQHDYFIADQNVDAKYVWLRRLHPDRWLSIWQTKADSSLLQKDSLIAIRNRMARQHYQGDVIDPEDLSFRMVDFEGQRAAKLSGLWRNDSLLVGGPFRMYAIYDPLEAQIYFIDLAVMAPGKLKKPFLDQLEVIARSFELVEAKRK